MVSFTTFFDSSRWKTAKSSGNPYLAAGGVKVTLHRRHPDGWTASICRPPFWNPTRLRESYETVDEAKAAAWRALTAGDCAEAA
jgi:hypothetical protein